MDTERSGKVIQALGSALNELKRARIELGNIAPDEDYVWLELCYMLVNTYRNLEGFIKARLKTEQKSLFEE